MTLSRGSVLQNRYRIISRLAHGGMGTVYRAWDTRLNMPVALKEMTPQPGLGADMLEQLSQQFEQEAVVLAKLSHPNLVDVTDFFEEDGNTYLVMNFIRGESLTNRIERDGPLPEAQVLEWTTQLLDALGYCHSQGVIHRDVKPHNVIVHPDGQAVLVDFGLVKLWDPNNPRTKTVMRGMGTPEYAPPEQFGTQPGHTGAHSDIYSLGATIYHALTGIAPPTANDRTVDPSLLKPPKALNPQLSPHVGQAILKAMEPQPGHRFQSAPEMAAALGAEPPSSAKSDSLKHQSKRMPGRKLGASNGSRRLPPWVWLLGVSGVMLLGGAGLLWGATRLTYQPQVALTATPTATATPKPSALPTDTPSPEPTPTTTPTPTLASAPKPTSIPPPTTRRTVQGETGLFVATLIALAVLALAIPPFLLLEQALDSLQTRRELQLHRRAFEKAVNGHLRNWHIVCRHCLRNLRLSHDIDQGLRDYASRHRYRVFLRTGFASKIPVHMANKHKLHDPHGELTYIVKRSPTRQIEEYVRLNTRLLLTTLLIIVLLVALSKVASTLLPSHEVLIKWAAACLLAISMLYCVLRSYGKRRTPGATDTRY